MKGLLVFLAIVAICAADNFFSIRVPKVEADPAYDFVKGFLEAIHETKKVEDLLKCMKNMDDIIAKIKDALQHFMKLTFDEIVIGFKILIAALQELEEMLKPCLDGFKQIQKLMEALKNINLVKIVTKILLNPGAFIHDVTDCIDSLKNLKFYPAGKDLGDILYRLFLSRAADPPYDFIKGFLVGIHETKKVEDLLKCIKNLDSIIAKIKEALEYFMKLTFDDLIKGFKLLTEALHELEQMLQPCLDGFKQIQKLMEAIKNLNIIKIVTKILLNPGAFIHDVQDCIESFKKMDLYTAGKDIGDILYRLFISRSVNNIPIVDFLSGLLKGIHETKSIEDLISCAKNAEPILEKIKIALDLIKKMTIESLLEGLTMLFEAFLELEEILRPCLVQFTQFKKLIDAIVHADINKLIQKIIQNAFQFIADIMDAIHAFEAKEMSRAGKDLGDVLYKLFLVELEVKFDPIDFIKGFLEGLNEKGDINNLLKCVKDIEKIVNKIIEAIGYISKMDFQNIIKGITLLLEAVSELLNELRPCSDGFEQIKKLIDAISHVDIVKLVFKILANPGPIIQDIMDCINAFNGGDFHRAGKDIGDLLFRMFLTSAQY